MNICNSSGKNSLGYLQQLKIKKNFIKKKNTLNSPSIDNLKLPIANPIDAINKQAKEQKIKTEIIVIKEDPAIIKQIIRTKNSGTQNVTNSTNSLLNNMLYILTGDIKTPAKVFQYFSCRKLCPYREIKSIIITIKTPVKMKRM